MPFITAGDPDYETTKELILTCERTGADVIELGVPFSDPIADGPVIQESFTRALSEGATVQKMFDFVKDLRLTCEIPIVSMVSYSIVFKRGVEQYMSKARQAGLDGVIIPDLPIEESEQAARIAGENILHLIFLVAPTTPMSRRRKIVKLCRGFIYCISVTGTTGARDKLPDDLVENITSIKQLTGIPVAVGFGVSNREQAAVVARHADGVIVGSAIVKHIAQNAGKSPAGIAAAVGDFIRDLIQGTKSVTKT